MTSGVYYHSERDIRVVTHVDVFWVAGEAHHLVWLRKELEKTYELKVQVAGWEAGDSRELSFLGRTIRLSASGIELEGDDQHVVGLIDEWDMKECSPVSTPYVKPPAHETSAEVDLRCPLRTRRCSAEPLLGSNMSPLIART